MAEQEAHAGQLASSLQASLPRACYCDAAFYERERRAILLTQWFYIGREDGLDAPGAYRVVDVGGESIIVVRGDSGALHAHLNLCRHRGSRLLCGDGNLRGAIRCPYHGWAYRIDGSLLASPFVEAETVPPGARRLYAADVESWEGFVFVRAVPAAPGAISLLQTLGEIPYRLARYPLSALRTAHSIAYDVEANWKVLLENYNECYHCAGVHPELCRIVPDFKRGGGSGLDWERGIPHRSGAWTFSGNGTSSRQPFEGLNDDERVRHKGELIYPNFMLSLSADHVAAFSLWPQSAARTTVVCDFLFHPSEIAARGFDPADAVAFWDTINRQDWAVCEGVQAGMRSYAFSRGYYAPMEDASLDIRRYIAAHLGDEFV